MIQIIKIRCEALRDMKLSGLRNYFIEHVPSIPPRTEYSLIMVRKTALDLKHLAYYRVTFEEIDGPDGTIVP